MSAYRRITRFLATIAAGVSILIGVTACHLPFTPTDVPRVTVHLPDVHPDVHLPDVHPDVPLPAIRPLPEKIAEIPGVLKDLNDVTDSPVRDAVIETACDAVAKGNYEPDWESDTLGNLLEDTQPPGKQLLDAVQNLAATFTDDEQNGFTTPEEIGMACQVYLLKGNLG